MTAGLAWLIVETMESTNTVTFPASQRPRLRFLLARLGLRAPDLLGASLPAIQRAAGGLPVRFGTALALQQSLERLPTDIDALNRVVIEARARRLAAPTEPRP